MNPPNKALVLCVDEKPSIQALERAQGYLRLPNGQALKGFNHEYERHGTTTLFAALDVLAGTVQRTSYLGDGVDYQVLVSASNVVLRVTAPPTVRFSPGDAVTLAVAPEACVPLADPGEANRPGPPG